MKKGYGKRIALYGGIAVAAIAALLMLFCFNPSKTGFFPPCPFHLLTGYHCAGCGSLRAIHCLLHGQVDDAMSLNPLMVISIPILGVMFLNPSWIYKKWVPWMAMIVLLVYGIIRNIPAWPFILLAP